MFDTSVKLNRELRLEFRKNLGQKSYLTAIHFYRSSFFFIWTDKSQVVISKDLQKMIQG